MAVLHKHEDDGKSYYATIRKIGDIGFSIFSIDLGELSIGNFNLTFYEHLNKKGEQVF